MKYVAGIGGLGEEQSTKSGPEASEFGGGGLPRVLACSEARRGWGLDKVTSHCDLPPRPPKRNGPRFACMCSMHMHAFEGSHTTPFSTQRNRLWTPIQTNFCCRGWTIGADTQPSVCSADPPPSGHLLPQAHVSLPSSIQFWLPLVRLNLRSWPPFFKNFGLFWAWPTDNFNVQIWPLKWDCIS